MIQMIFSLHETNRKDTSLYTKKFLNSCLISSTALVNEYRKCSALLTDVTPDLNLENQSYG